MKKYLLIVSSMLITASGMCLAVDANDVKNEFQAAIEFAFFKNGDMAQVKATFYNFPIGATAITRCNAAVTTIKDFVNSNSKNIVGMKDAALSIPATQLGILMTKTINAINEISNNKKLDSDIYFTQLDQECRTAKALLEKEQFDSSKKQAAQGALVFAFDLLSNLIMTAKEASAIARRMA